MQKITINSNDAGRRLDRFMRRFLCNATLASIYKIIRKDVKVNGRRQPENYMLAEGDELTLYLSDALLAELTGKVAGFSEKQSGRPGNNGGSRRDAACAGTKQSGRAVSRGGRGGRKAKRQFGIVYEDDNILIADKPFGLLTHGDATEKKNHLANQVTDYLIGTGAYDPRELTFRPAPANRLDRNTTGLVLFGKTAPALRALTAMIRSDSIAKFYRTVVFGAIREELDLTARLLKDEESNTALILGEDAAEGKAIHTIVRPIELLGGGDATYVEIELATGRTHQIRAHLASIGHPVIGDTKYATGAAVNYNGKLYNIYGLKTQLLHSARVEFKAKEGELAYLSGRSFSAEPPERFRRILASL